MRRAKRLGRALLVITLIFGVGATGGYLVTRLQVGHEGQGSPPTSH